MGILEAEADLVRLLLLLLSVFFPLLHSWFPSSLSATRVSMVVRVDNRTTPTCAREGSRLQRKPGKCQSPSGGACTRFAKLLINAHGKTSFPSLLLSSLVLRALAFSLLCIVPCTPRLYDRIHESGLDLGEVRVTVRVLQYAARD